MKTFTTYAEKKAKQILNLLQGYTKSIRITAILILLLMGVNNAWGWTTYYLKSDNTTWDTGNNGWGFNQDGTTTTYMDKNSEFKLWRTDWGNDGWFGAGDSNGSKTLKAGDGGLQFLQYKANVKYNGPSGMVCFHMSQEGNNNTNDKPWVWITRPTFYLKHNWGGGSWSWKALTDNEDGTYTLVAKYGGTGVNYGDNNDNNSNGWGYVTATVSGNPTTSDDCEFKFNSKDKTVTITKINTEKKFNVTAVANPTAGGTVTPTTATQMGQNTGGEITASAKTGYTFTNWKIKSGSGYFGESGTNITSTTANTKFRPKEVSTVQANFTANTYTVDFNANGGSGTMNSQRFTYGVAQNLTANLFTRNGYTFAGWATSSNGSVVYANQQSVSNLTSTNNGTITLYAKWNEKTVTISPTNAYDKGNPGYANPTASNNGKIGITSTSQLVAPVPGEGYTFAGWTLSDNIVVTNGDPTTSRTITVRHKTGDGSAVTAVANYNENLDSDWHLVGNNSTFFPDGWTVSDGNKMKKRSGSANEKVVYMTLSFSASQTYEFKVVDNSSGSAKWYGYSTNGTYLTWTETSTKTVYTGDNNANNLKFKPSITGEYEFKVNYSGDYPEVTITYPTSYTVTYSRVPETAADAPTTNPSVNSGNLVLSGTSMTFTAKDAKDGYAWKGWYNNNAGTGTELTTNKAYATTITDNTTIYAVYTANTYTVELNQEGATTVGTESVTATYGAAMPNITILPTRTGYTFLGYWTEKERGTQYYNANGTSARNWDQTSDDILYAHWEEAQYTVTFGVHSTGHGQILFENTSTVISGYGSSTSQQKHGASISFTATPSAGYEVEGWYSNAACTERIEAAGTHTRYNPAPVTSDVTIFVKFKEETRRIYLKPAGDNGWAGGDPRYVVYIKNDGSGNEDTSWSKEVNMTKINDGDSDTGNDIYYADILKKYSHVIFCRMNPGNNTNNWDNRWTQTKDLQILEDCNLFDVAADASTENQYLADGQWMEYNAWQLVGSFSSWDPCGNRFDENSDGTYTYTIELTAGDYEFKLVRNGIWYGNNGDMERNGTGVQSGGWDMYHDAGDCTLKADMTGNYIFTIHKNGKLTVTYPVTGYQLKITMKSGKVYTSNSVGNAGDILSFFAPGKNETGDNAGVVELCFEGKPIQTISYATFETSNVYVAKLNANKDGITDVALYDGNYYIRTDGAAGGWNNYKQNSNKMTYFVPRADEKYSYYWVESVRHSNENNRVNVKGCVANQYNNDLAGMLENDKFTDVNGDVYIQDPTVNGSVHIERVNLRFGYNPKTNHFERAMLTGSGNINSFLNITDPDGKIYKTYKDGQFDTPLTARDKDSKFTDISNWVYERDVWVKIPQNEDVTVRLTARAYNGADNSLFGFEDEEYQVPIERIIVGAGSTPGPKKMRVIYDFKTNRMIMAWIPGAYTCNSEEILHADVLFMRHENEIVPQLIVEKATNQATPQIKGIKSQFFALEFDKYEKTKLMEEQYWFTLPFDCVVGSISGVPGYMQTWGIQRYDGELRAKNGWFDPKTTFWDWLGPNDVMEAGVGYVLSFDKNAATWSDFDVHDDNGNLTETISVLRLYFPSTEEGFTFESTTALAKTYKPIPCKIETANRDLQDGHWRIIGPLSYNSASASPECATDSVWKPVTDSTHIDVPDGEYTWDRPMFLYDFWQDDSNRSNWKYIVKSANNHTYQAFYGYMVQFAGTITWSEITQSTHSALRARTYTDQVPTNITTNLELLDAEGVQHDQTFVALDVEGTTTYDLNKDLNKVFNNNFANIYTLSEGIPFAGNTLPMEKATVPVGVRIATAGEYTFRMPDGTEGIYVTLIDNQTGTQTDMLMSEYTVTLDAGTIENRFYLVVDPDRAATSVENVGEEAKGDKAKGVEKFLIDGKLFIRTTDGIFDAKGQRL